MAKKKLHGLSMQAYYTERPPLISEVNANFFVAYSRILGFLDRRTMVKTDTK
jgi:hypothetical protein